MPSGLFHPGCAAHDTYYTLKPVYLLVNTPPVQRSDQSRLLGGKGDPMPYNCCELVPLPKDFF